LREEGKPEVMHDEWRIGSWLCLFDDRQASSGGLETYVIAFVQLARYCVDTPACRPLLQYMNTITRHSNGMFSVFKGFQIFYLMHY
jgi:hypothetical protein